jgi:hypothetical protein
MRYGTPIQTYTVLPPKWRIVYSEDHLLPPAERYLRRVDESLRQTQLSVAYRSDSDLVSMVFTNQALTHALKSRHVAQLLTERRTLAQTHLEGLQANLEQLRSRLTWRGGYSARIPRDRAEQDLERQILDLERQEREIEVTVWRDTLELRRELVDERREYQATRGRMNFLTGGSYASP